MLYTLTVARSEIHGASSASCSSRGTRDCSDLSRAGSERACAGRLRIGVGGTVSAPVRLYADVENLHPDGFLVAAGPRPEPVIDRRGRERPEPRRSVATPIAH